MKQSYFSNRRLTRNNKGFSLVELIVVIAIMAILAGVGVAGYTKYIEHANKQADMALVGNIMRAVETGNASYMYQLNEVLQASPTGAQIPVGFIVLTNSDDSGITMESESGSVSLSAKGGCKIVTEELVVDYKASTTKDKYKSGCEYKEDIVYDITSENVTYCSVHSSPTSTRLTYWKNESGKNENDDEKESDSRSFKLKENIVGPEDGHENGKILDEEITGKYYGQFVEASNNGMLNESIKAAFGENPNLQLKYNKWSEHSIPSFWSNASTTWKNVEDLANMVQTIIGYKDAVAFFGYDLLGLLDFEEHDSAAGMIHDISADVTTNLSQKEFTDIWDSIGDLPSNRYNGNENFFGLDNREKYSALRAAYNNSFASYVSLHHSGEKDIVDAHVDAIANYGEPASELVDEKLGDSSMANLAGTLVNLVATENFPKQICASSFTTDEGKSYLGAASGCQECEDLYETYVTSDADRADGEAMYQTFQTAASADENLINNGYKDATGNTIDFFDFYESYLKEFEGMYNSVNSITKDNESSIVISVYYQDNKLSCLVSPTEANPREQK